MAALTNKVAYEERKQASLAWSIRVSVSKNCSAFNIHIPLFSQDALSVSTHGL